MAGLKAMCALILRDEGGHVAFHRDRLAAAGRSGRGLAGWLWRTQFWLCGYGAATMLWVNHRACFVPIGGTTAEFYGEVTRELKRFTRSLAVQARSERTIERTGSMQRLGSI
jgi:hypothetical protein